jgi:hypothetical protein
LSTKITDTEMTSDQTRHTASAIEGSRYGSWTTTWLPGVALSYNQAITAMTIAEVVATHDWKIGGGADPIWVHMDGWAAELGITGPHALAMASMSPEDAADLDAR